MKHQHYAVLAMLMYAVTNVIISRKLSQIHPVMNMTLLYITSATIMTTVILFAMRTGLTFGMPDREQMPFFLAMVLAFVCAEYFYFSAYSKGGSIMTVTTTVVIFPVIASAIDALFGGALPSIRQVVGWLLAVVAVILVGKK